MKHVQSYETFLNEATVSLRKTSFGQNPGWGPKTNGGGLGYAGSLKYLGGKIKLIGRLENNTDEKIVGKVIIINFDLEKSMYGKSVKYKNERELIDLIEGIKEFSDLIKKNAHKEYDEVPDSEKRLTGAAHDRDYNPTVFIKKLNPLKTIKVDIWIENTTGVNTEEEQEIVNKAVAEIVPGAYNIGVTDQVAGMKKMLTLAYEINV